VHAKPFRARSPCQGIGAAIRAAGIERMNMGRQGEVQLARILAGVALAVCVAAIFDPRLRRACIGLLCRIS
jgi:hypothetical protein